MSDQFGHTPPEELPAKKVPARSTGRALTPMQMIDKALTMGASPEALEKLMGLQERWERNEARKAYDAAIADFRSRVTPIIKARTADFELKGGGRASYKYEDMALVAEMVDPLFAELGLSYRYKSRVDAGQVYVTCIISHRLGHREETELSAPLDTTGAKNSVQAVGSTVSYLQRYTLKLGAGLAATKDDDAKRGGAEEEQETISAEQYIALNNLLEKTGKSEDDLLIFLGLRPDFDLHLLPIRLWEKGMFGMQKFIDDHIPKLKPKETPGGSGH